MLLKRRLPSVLKCFCTAFLSQNLETCLYCMNLYNTITSGETGDLQTLALLTIISWQRLADVWQSSRKLILQHYIDWWRFCSGNGAKPEQTPRTPERLSTAGFKRADQLLCMLTPDTWPQRFTTGTNMQTFRMHPSCVSFSARLSSDCAWPRTLHFPSGSRHLLLA